MKIEALQIKETDQPSVEGLIKYEQTNRVRVPKRDDSKNKGEHPEIGMCQRRAESIKLMKIEDLKIQDPFKDLFLVDSEIREEIKENMKIHGYDPSQPIVVWNRIVVDGHTKLQAALETGIKEVPVCEKEFANEDEAIQYMIHNQLNRRNLTDRDILRLVEKLDKRYKIGRPKITSGEVFWKDHNALKHLQIESLMSRLHGKGTSKKTAKIIGISATKVEKTRTILDRAALHPTYEKAKQAVLMGEISINKAYNVVMKKYGSRTLEFEPGVHLTIEKRYRDEDFALEMFLRQIDWMILGTGQAPNMGNFEEGSRLYFPKGKKDFRDNCERKMTPEEWNKFLEESKRKKEEFERRREIERLKEQVISEVGQFSTA